jgi:hypothetical protein
LPTGLVDQLGALVAGAPVIVDLSQITLVSPAPVMGFAAWLVGASQQPASTLRSSRARTVGSGIRVLPGVRPRGVSAPPGHSCCGGHNIGSHKAQMPWSDLVGQKWMELFIWPLVV